MEFTILNIIIIAILAYIINTIGYWRGWKMREKTAQAYMDNLMKKATEIRKVKVYVQRDNDVFHIYNEENNSFIMTVKNIDEAKERLEQHFKGMNVTITEANAKEQGFI